MLLIVLQLACARDVLPVVCVLLAELSAARAARKACNSTISINSKDSNIHSSTCTAGISSSSTARLYALHTCGKCSMSITMTGEPGEQARGNDLLASEAAAAAAACEQSTLHGEYLPEMHEAVGAGKEGPMAEMAAETQACSTPSAEADATACVQRDAEASLKEMAARAAATEAAAVQREWEAVSSALSIAEIFERPEVGIDHAPVHVMLL